MKYLVLILFITFGLQNDTTKVDTILVQQSIIVQNKFKEVNSKLDSLLLILAQDTIKNKKQKK